jgi:hypothetical protein
MPTAIRIKNSLVMPQYLHVALTRGLRTLARLTPAWLRQSRGFGCRTRHHRVDADIIERAHANCAGSIRMAGSRRGLLCGNAVGRIGGGRKLLLGRRRVAVGWSGYRTHSARLC